MKIAITLEFNNLSQVEAVQCALEQYLDMEADRARCAPSDFTLDDKRRMTGGREVLASITGDRTRIQP